MGRSSLGPGGSLCLAVLALGSCTALGLVGSEASFRTTLAPELAAWLSAEACRVELPGADPLPLHPGAPVLRHGENDYEVRYNRAAPQGYRIYTNGRLLPSNPTGQAQEGQPLANPSFQAAPHLTGHRAPGPDEVRIQIRPTPEGSQVELQLSGAVVGGTLTHHVNQLLRLAEAIQETAVMVRRQEWEMVRRRVDEALSQFGSGCCGSHQPLRARLLVHRAAAEQAQGHLLAARACTAEALGLAPANPGLRLWQVRLDQRLGLDREAATDWRILAASPSRGGFSNVAAGELQTHVDALLRPGPGPRLRERAGRLLRDNDVAGARAQLDMARSLDPLPQADLKGLTLWHQRLGHHRAAFEVALQRLEFGADPALILEMTEHCARTDQPTLGLRLLAKHWDELLVHDRAAAEAWLHYHAQQAGAEMATRVLTAAGAMRLAQEQLAHWIHSGRADPDVVDVLALIWWLRIEKHAELRDWQGTSVRDYESAPGVLPLR